LRDFDTAAAIAGFSSWKRRDGALEPVKVAGIGPDVPLATPRSLVTGTVAGLKSEDTVVGFATSPCLFTWFKNAQNYTRLRSGQLHYILIRCQPGCPGTGPSPAPGNAAALCGSGASRADPFRLGCPPARDESGRVGCRFRAIAHVNRRVAAWRPRTFEAAGRPARTSSAWAVPTRKG